MMIPVRFYALSVVISSLFLTTGCSSTQSMPNGYTYNDNTPLSSPAPSRPWSKNAVLNDTEAMGTNTAAWQGAVYELIDQLKAQLPKDGTPLNLSNVETGLDNSLDHHLRQALIQKGYNLTTQPDAGLRLVQNIKKDKAVDTYIISSFIMNKDDKALFIASISAVIPQK